LGGNVRPKRRGRSIAIALSRAAIAASRTRLFNSSEKRLARILLLLAQFGKDGKPETVIPKMSQETLAEMIGTTRSRVSFFMNRFRKLGFIDYHAGDELQVHSSLLNIVLHD
jgi:CRP-like cAMP-binding protein